RHQPPLVVEARGGQAVGEPSDQLRHRELFALHEDPWPWSVFFQHQRNGESLQFDRDVVFCTRGFLQCESTRPGSVQFQLPRLAVDEQQLPGSDRTVEVKLFPCSITWADNLDCEVRSAVPERVTVLCGVVDAEKGSVRDTVVRLPIFLAIR